MLPRHAILALAWLPLLAPGAGAAAAQEPGGVAPQEAAPAPDPAREAVQRRVDAVAPRVAALRGREFKRPVPAGVHTPEQFLEFARREFAEEYGPGKLRRMGEAYALLGLMEPGLDLEQTVLELLRGQVGGYYDPKTKTFYMISTYNQGGIADLIMAHELTHALDDQYYDLDAMFEAAKGNSDREFAVRAVAEGSGMSLMSLYTVEQAAKGTLDLDVAAMMETMEEQMEVLELTPPFLVMTLALPYLEGNKLLARESNAAKASMARPALEDLDRAFRNPPLSSEQVLHFEKYWDPDRRDDPMDLALPDFSGELGSSWSLGDSDVLGELGCYAVTAKVLPNFADPSVQLTARWTSAAAAGWDGDRYQLFQGPEGALALVWASVWDTLSDRQEFGAALEATRQRNPALRAIHQGSDAVVAFYANDAGEPALDALRAAVLRARPDWR